MDKKIILVGAPRSGTSYLARAIGLADDVAYFEESGAFSHYGPRRFPRMYTDVLKNFDVFKFHRFEHSLLRVTDSLRGLDRLDNMVYRMLLHTKLQPYDLKPSKPLIVVQACDLEPAHETLREQLVDKYRTLASEQGAQAMFNTFFGDFVRLSGRKHLLEKTPKHIGYVPVIHSIFPDARVVCIRRDKKDTVASYLRNFDARTGLANRFRSDRGLLKSQAKACRYYDQVEEWIAAQPWCRIVDYPRFIESPLETVADILQWAGMSINKEKYRPLFAARKTSSKWDRLSIEEQLLVEKILG